MKRVAILSLSAVLLSACGGDSHLTPRQEARRNSTTLSSCNDIASRTARGRCLMAESRRHYLYTHPAGTRRPVTRHRKRVRHR
ncbi:hypothetical protein LOC54_10840 [Acetobacter sp. AN02]|nr:hypothetical protein [Acetobacter sp. AN02]